MGFQMQVRMDDFERNTKEKKTQFSKYVIFWIEEQETRKPFFSRKIQILHQIQWSMYDYLQPHHIILFENITDRIIWWKRIQEIIV